MRDFDFKLILVLIYFKEYKNDYLLSEICNLCSFTTKQLNDSIKFLINDGYLIERNNILILTIKGNEFLAEEGYDRILLNDLNNNLVTLNLNENMLSFDDIYIPNGFKP